MSMQSMQTPVISIYEVGDYDRQIGQAVELLKQGKIVVLPTETVYGAAGLLRDPGALERLRHLRPDPEGRPAAKPFIPHLADAKQATTYLDQPSELGQRMMKKLWPGPVALVFEVSTERQVEVAGQLGVNPSDLYDGRTITLRCPDHIIATDVIAQVGDPVVAVRAGIASTQPALRAEQVAQELDGKVDLIIDGGPSRYSKPSTIVHVKADGYEIVRTGVYDERIIERLLRTTILFVCSGNTCRSPMAEAIAKRVLSEQLHVPENELEKKGINVLSAGTFANPGTRATPQGVEAMRNLGTDLSHHRSRPLSIELIHQADVIYTMSRAHAQAVRALVPSASDKVDTLAPGADIDDPIGGDTVLYQELAGQLRTLIENRLRENALT
jgi:tRNA threonylcarbamoyl adenosine modification protein (Sua5/YciO/YrdC/YwlC family)